MTTYVPAAAAVIIILTFIVGFTGLVIHYLRVIFFNKKDNKK